MLICQEIKSKESWDGFVTSQPVHTFLHSWSWGEFTDQMGDKAWRLGIYSSSELIAVALVIKVYARRGNFLFIPHGPIGDKRALLPPSAGGGLVKTLKELARQENVSFIRISPLLENTLENQQLFRRLGFRPAPIHMHAETTWTLDLTPSEEELLMGMRKTTRNLIRRAIKEGVEVKMSASPHDVENFNNLYR